MSCLPGCGLLKGPSLICVTPNNKNTAIHAMRPLEWETKTKGKESPNSDQHQFSPNDIHTLSRDKVMRINKMITTQKMLWSIIKFSQLILYENVYRDQFGEFVCEYWG